MNTILIFIALPYVPIPKSVIVLGRGGDQFLIDHASVKLDTRETTLPADAELVLVASSGNTAMETNRKTIGKP